VIACSTIPARIVFGRALETPDTEDLRRHLARAMDRPELEAVAVAVETFFDLFHGLARIASDAAPRDTPHHVLILDLQRAIVFRDSGVAGEPGLLSLVRFLLDGYPLQPFLRFADAEQDRPWRFSFIPRARLPDGRRAVRTPLPASAGHASAHRRRTLAGRGLAIASAAHGSESPFGGASRSVGVRWRSGRHHPPRTGRTESRVDAVQYHHDQPQSRRRE
jgi:hypothetical protein